MNDHKEVENDTFKTQYIGPIIASGFTESSLESWKRVAEAAAIVLDRKLSAEVFWKQLTRMDGRVFLQCRKTHIQTGIIPTLFHQQQQQPQNEHFTNHPSLNPPVVVGSAQVSLGMRTRVLAVVSAHIGHVVAAATTESAVSRNHMESSSSRSDSCSSMNSNQRRKSLGGDIWVTCSACHASHRNADRFLALTSFLQRILEENVDLEQLLIIPTPTDPIFKSWSSSSSSSSPSSSSSSSSSSKYTQQAFRLCVSVEVLDDSGGNVTDAALIACTAALTDTRLPLTTIDKNGRVWLQNTSPSTAARHNKRLICTRLPIPLTIGSWVNYNHDDVVNSMNDFRPRRYLIVDPNAEEIDALTGIVTVVVDAAKMSTDEKSNSVSNFSPPLLAMEVMMLPTIDQATTTGGMNLSTLALAAKIATGRAVEIRRALQVKIDQK